MIERILQIIEYKGINKSIFYKNTGLSNGFLDKVKDIGASKLELILNTYDDIDMEWLLTGKGSMLKVEQKEGNPPDIPNEDVGKIAMLNQLLQAKDEIIEGLKYKVTVLEAKAKEHELGVQRGAVELANKQKLGVFAGK